jgi:cobalt/nickel transport system permease protein
MTASAAVESRSMLSRCDARTRIVLAFGLVVTVASMPLAHPTGAISLLALVLLFLALTRPPLRKLATAGLAVVPFAGGAALFLPLVVPGEAWWSQQIGPWLLEVSREGLLAAGEILLRALLAATTMAALVACTPFHRLTEGLQGLGLPAPVVLTLCSLHRYVPVVGAEAFRLVRSARARAGARGGGFAATGALLASLLLRSLDRADRVHRAMVARGFDGSVPDGDRPPLPRRDLAWLGAGMVIIVGTVITSMVVGGEWH